MKKTLLVTLEYPPMVGGVAQYYSHIVQELPKGDIHVLDNEEEYLLSGQWLWPRWLKGLVNTYRAVRKYDIEHILVGQILPVGTMALILYKFFGIPYTVMTHGMDVTIPFGASGSVRKQNLVHKILHNADSVTTVSQYTKTQLLNLGVDEDKIHIVYPCPHMTDASAADNQLDKDIVDTVFHTKKRHIVLSVGRLVERKGHDMVIRAIAKLKDQFPQILYAIIGDGNYREELEFLVQGLEVENNVLFLGKLNDTQVKEWYTRCDMFAMPSRQLENGDVEGFGIVFLEANSFGKPVIAGNSGGIPDAVVDGETGFLVDPLDAEMIADSIERLLLDKTLAQKMGEKGRERTHAEFRWDVQASKLRAIIDS